MLYCTCINTCVGVLFYLNILLLSCKIKFRRHTKLNDTIQGVSKATPSSTLTFERQNVIKRALAHVVCVNHSRPTFDMVGGFAPAPN